MNRKYKVLVMLFLVAILAAGCKSNEAASQPVETEKTVQETETGKETEPQIGGDIEEMKPQNQTQNKTENIGDAPEEDVESAQAVTNDEEQLNTEETKSRETKPENGNNTENRDPLENRTDSQKPESKETVPEDSASEEIVPEDSANEETKAATESTAELTEYERYMAMSGQEQQAYMESFDSVAAFFEWYNNAKAEYEAAHPAIVIDGSPIDAEELIEMIE